MNSLIKKLLVIPLFLLSGVTGCAQEKSRSMTVDELRKAAASDSSLVILDVRTPEELNGPLGHIKGVVNIPVQELESRISEMEKYRNRPVAIICRSGHRSGIAQKILKQRGFNAINVEGGMNAYRNTER